MARYGVAVGTDFKGLGAETDIRKELDETEYTTVDC
jgi:hypothetical protein